MALSEKYKLPLAMERQGTKDEYVAVALPKTVWAAIAEKVSNQFNDGAFPGQHDRQHFLEAVFAAIEHGVRPPIVRHIIDLKCWPSEIIMGWGANQWEEHRTKFERQKSMNYAAELVQPRLPEEFWAHWDACIAMLEDAAKDKADSGR